MKNTITQKDILKAIRKGSRDAEFELLGPGFHSKTKVAKSKKVYNRKKQKQYEKSNRIYNK